jgi:hypothetical protein
VLLNSNPPWLTALAGVPHVQHMGSMNASWAPASPPSSMAMVGQLGRGATKHLLGLGARWLRPGLLTPGHGSRVSGLARSSCGGWVSGLRAPARAGFWGPPEAGFWSLNQVKTGKFRIKSVPVHIHTRKNTFSTKPSNSVWFYLGLGMSGGR